MAPAKLENEKARGKARDLYKALLNRFPDDDLAIDAAKRLTALGDAGAAEKAAAKAARAARQAKKARAAQQQSAREAASRASACAHVYRGKTFKARGGFLGLKQTYRVVGFSASSQRVTITSHHSPGYNQEISCSGVPR